jgi:hypothetical protein
MGATVAQITSAQVRGVLLSFPQWPGQACKTAIAVNDAQRDIVVPIGMHEQAKNTRH